MSHRPACSALPAPAQGSFEGGHYVCYARLGRSWYKFNDSKVTRVDERTVLDAQAFVLFYGAPDP